MVGDARALLAEMPAGSVDLIATSPPYLSLRSYLKPGDPFKELEIGSEPTPAAFISTLLGLTAQFRRVLAPHGSIAIELGDTYSGSGGAGGDYGPAGLRNGQPEFDGSAARTRSNRPSQYGTDSGPTRRTLTDAWPLERSLCMVPELYRVALAYGVHPLTGEPSPAGRWRVRNVVVHGRPNPPVGSLGDKYRPACSYWAVACVNRRWFDLDAVRTPASGYERPNGAARATAPGKRPNRCLDTTNEAGAPPLDWFEDECDQFERDLWTIPTSPYSGAHYATFAPELIRRFVVSMCPARVCRECGVPSKRITAKSPRYKAIRDAVGDFNTFKGANDRGTGNNGGSRAGQLGSLTTAEYETLGWTDCGHNAWRPGLVLDPFGGSGTTGMVAAGNGRDALLFDLDERNVDLARQRVGWFLDEVGLAEMGPEA
jgi:hypothetical protein